MKPKKQHPTQVVNLELGRPVLIHVCKDRTLSFRERNEKVFNGVALPVFSVENKDEARHLILMVGRKQYSNHPLIPNEDWYKITLDGALDFKQHLELFDLAAVTDKLKSAYNQMKEKAT